MANCSEYWDPDPDPFDTMSVSGAVYFILHVLRNNLWGQGTLPVPLFTKQQFEILAEQREKWKASFA